MSSQRKKNRTPNVVNIPRRKINTLDQTTKNWMLEVLKKIFDSNKATKSFDKKKYSKYDKTKLTKIFVCTVIEYNHKVRVSRYANYLKIFFIFIECLLLFLGVDQIKSFTEKQLKNLENYEVLLVSLSHGKMGFIDFSIEILKTVISEITKMLSCTLIPYFINLVLGEDQKTLNGILNVFLPVAIKMVNTDIFSARIIHEDDIMRKIEKSSFDQIETFLEKENELFDKGMSALVNNLDKLQTLFTRDVDE